MYFVVEFNFKLLSIVCTGITFRGSFFCSFKSIAMKSESRALKRHFFSDDSLRPLGITSLFKERSLFGHLDGSISFRDEQGYVGKSKF